MPPLPPSSPHSRGDVHSGLLAGTVTLIKEARGAIIRLLALIKVSVSGSTRSATEIADTHSTAAYPLW